VRVAIETPRSLIDWVGREITVTDWFSISQSRLLALPRAISGFHLDGVRARCESPHRTTIAHRFLTLSLLPLSEGGNSESARSPDQYQLPIESGSLSVPRPAADSRIRASLTTQSTKNYPRHSK